MRMTNRRNMRSFYVVQFIEPPFQGIHDKVCVPYSWIIAQSSYSPKVVVTYPNNEDPIDTRNRVKRKERPNDEWRFYLALKKYESDDCSDAEKWISKSDNGPGEEKIGMRDTQPEHELKVNPYKNPRKPLPKISIRRPLSQSPDKNLDNKRLKLNANAKLGIDTDLVNIASGFSKQELSRIITDNQLIQNDQTKTSFASNGMMNSEQSTQPGVIENNQSTDTYVSPV